MSTRSSGAWIVAVFSVSTSTMSVRMSVVVMFTLPVLSLVDLAFRRRVGSVPPAGEQRGVFSGFFFPAEMARASNEIDLGVGPGHHLVVGSGNDPDRCFDAWQQLGEFWKVFAVALGVRDGVGEAIAFVARHVVFADLVGRGVARDGAQGDLDDLAPSDLAVGLQVGCFDPLFENSGDI